MSKTTKQQGTVSFGTIKRRLLTAFILVAVLSTVLGIISNNLHNPTLTILFLCVMFIFTVVYGFILSKRICNPLEKMYITIHELRLGHLNARSGYRSKDDIGLMSVELDSLALDIKDNILGVISKISDGDVTMNVEMKDKNDMVTPELKKIITCMRSLSHETERLITAVSSGNLNERGYTGSYKGSWKYLIEGINTLVDKISTPINEVMAVTRCLAANDYTRAIENQYEGAFNDLAADVNEVRDNLLTLQDAVVRVSSGDTEQLEEFEKIGKKSENDYMIPSIIKMMQTIRELIAEIGKITSESTKGHITNTRGDASLFEGGYKEIIEGVNSTFDTILKPIQETIRVLDAVAVNDLTTVPDESVMIGDFEHLGKSIEQVQNNVSVIQNVTVQVSNGDISALERIESIGKLSDKDQLVPAFTKMMRSINSLMEETAGIANAALEGRLDYRSDTSKLEGEFANILKSFNTAFHGMAKPVNEISNVMGQIAEGNLSASVTGNYNGAFGKLSGVVNETISTINTIIGKISFVLTNIADSNLDLQQVEAYHGDFAAISDGLNTIINTLNELVKNISTATDQVASGAKQVSEGSQNLSHGATEQASSVEQLTASISEISSQTKNNATNANEANSLAKTTKDSAVQGNSQMKEMLTAMNDINESSSNISKIIKVIDDIAFQTNILALNAAVEAARAGQYGKGFAVVAEEVRNLAARSANAANDTTTLIEGSIQKITSGTDIANHTASALSDIVSSVDKVSDLVSDIAVASNEQATGIAQIDKGVEVVSNVVQTNSATAEQSAAASEQLSSQAEYLREMLAKFKLRQE
jgi:methyl-accepting chemotaxis protein